VVEELNVSELKTAHPDDYGSTLAVPNFKALGARLGKRMGPVATAIKALTPQQIAAFQKEGSITVDGEPLSSDEVRQNLPAFAAAFFERCF
jgi:isoleucyl-tRNA synthetase